MLHKSINMEIFNTQHRVQQSTITESRWMHWTLKYWANTWKGLAMYTNFNIYNTSTYLENLENNLNTRERKDVFRTNPLSLSWSYYATSTQLVEQLSIQSCSAQTPLSPPSAIPTGHTCWAVHYPGPIRARQSPLSNYQISSFLLDTSSFLKEGGSATDTMTAFLQGFAPHHDCTIVCKHILYVSTFLKKGISANKRLGRL